MAAHLGMNVEPMATAYTFVYAEADMVWHIILFHFHNGFKSVLHKANR